MEKDAVFSDLAARQPSFRAADAAAWLIEAEAAAFAALRAGTAAWALPCFDRLSDRWPDSARLHWLRALLLREEQSHEAALRAAQEAVRRAADDARAQALIAQLRYETGRTAAADFAAARRLAPDEPGLIRGQAGALAAEGEGAGALALLDRALADRPGWVEGQAYRATLGRLCGIKGREDGGFAAAAALQPRNLALWMAWFHWRAKTKDWAGARDVLAQARRACGDAPAIEVAGLYLAAESGEAQDRPDLFDGHAASGDPGLMLAQVRHALRCGAPDRAAGLAWAQIGTPAASLFWPYLSLCWRLLGDDRASWLDRPEQFISVSQIGLDMVALEEMGALLRTLHGAAAPYPDQSVRGGTQTDRPLLFRREPVVRQVRSAIEAAARDYVDALPPPEPGHPLLGTPRGEVMFAGSWSVRLSAQGYHAAHSHPAGWISSALYVSLPEPAMLGMAPAGWLRFGTPPPELGLDLAPFSAIEPGVGRLVLFPSTLWHGTIPFDDGERLSIAFDVRTPRF